MWFKWLTAFILTKITLIQIVVPKYLFHSKCFPLPGKGYFPNNINKFMWDFEFSESFEDKFHKSLPFINLKFVWTEIGDESLLLVISGHSLEAPIEQSFSGLQNSWKTGIDQETSQICSAIWKKGIMTKHLKAKSLTNQIFAVGLVMDDYHCFQIKGTFYVVSRQCALTWPMCVCLACYKMQKAVTFCNLWTRRTPPSDIGSLKKPQKYGIWPSDQI